MVEESLVAVAVEVMVEVPMLKRERGEMVVNVMLVAVAVAVVLDFLLERVKLVVTAVDQVLCDTMDLLAMVLLVVMEIELDQHLVVQEDQEVMHILIEVPTVLVVMVVMVVI